MGPPALSSGGPWCGTSEAGRSTAGSARAALKAPAGSHHVASAAVAVSVSTVCSLSQTLIADRR